MGQKFSEKEEPGGNGKEKGNGGVVLRLEYCKILILHPHRTSSTLQPSPSPS